MSVLKEPQSVQFVTNSAGEKTAVIVPLTDYQELLDDLSDLAAIAERRDEPTVSHDELLSELKRDGHLPALSGNARQPKNCGRCRLTWSSELSMR